MGNKDGFGKYTYINGANYEGQWEDNRVQGYGKQLWKDGKEFYGQWD